MLIGIQSEVGGGGMFALAFFFPLRTRRLNKLKKVKEYRGLVKS